jgi:hypothetical protein
MTQQVVLTNLFSHQREKGLRFHNRLESRELKLYRPQSGNRKWASSTRRALRSSCQTHVLLIFWPWRARCSIGLRAGRNFKGTAVARRGSAQSTTSRPALCSPRPATRCSRDRPCPKAKKSKNCGRFLYLNRRPPASRPLGSILTVPKIVPTTKPYRV